MKTSDIKKLAQHSLSEGKINQKFAKFVMENLSKRELREYLFYLKKEVRSQIVYVRTGHTLSKAQKKQFEQIFEDKKITYESDVTLGAGAIIINNDNIIDASLKGFIDQAILELKN